MSYFHYRCGERITLLHDNCTAVRNDSDFDHGIVISAEPLVNDVLFEIKIDRKVASWSGSLEIGVTEVDPLNFEFPPCASKLQGGSWIMTGSSVLKDGSLLVERYGPDLDKLNQDDRVGVMRTSEGELVIYINGEPQGVAAEGLPQIVYALVDLYGKCVQVSIVNPVFREHNNDDCLSGSSILAIDNDNLNVTLGADLSELSLSSNNSLDVRMDMSVSAADPIPRHDKLRFHERCGSLVKLSNGQRTAERRRPLDEFNNGVVMTHRPLFDSELFEIRIDRLVDKWSGSIEMGITTHNPNTLVFPATMTNMRSGTIMMSGCGILTNGKGTRREYGDFNLDELSEGDRVGMMRKPDGNLHYFINGLDQGIAAQRVPTTVWGVIDLYGMTIKVSIVERDEREEQNLMTRRNTRDQQILVPEPHPLSDYYDRLTFHSNCGTHAQVINNGRTAHRPNATDDFNNAVVLTGRALKTGELFEVRLDRVVTKWAGSIEIGVTTHSPTELEFPFTMTNVRSGTWMMTGSGIMHNGTTVLEQYGVNLDRLQVGDRVGVLRKENGLLHFFVNGTDQGTAASNVPERIYGVIDLYGQAVEASIVDGCDYGSPDTLHSSFSNTTLYSDLRFHHVHGKNVRIVNNGLTALRPRPLAEFNDAIVFSNRPLRDGELFEIVLDNMVDRWSGGIELGVTAVRPDDIDLPSTATDLCRDTWMLSGSSVMENGSTVKNNYPCDLDTLPAGTRLGVVRTADKTLEFYRNGIPEGVACIVPHNNVYAVVDLYGQCAQVSIPCSSPGAAVGPCIPLGSCARSETSASLQVGSNAQPNTEVDLHRFSDFHSKNITLSDGGRVAVRGREQNNSVVYSATCLSQEEMFEVAIHSLQNHLAGTLCIGVSVMVPSTSVNGQPSDFCYVTGNELRWKNHIIQHFSPNLSWLQVGDRIGLYQTLDGILKLYINGEEVHLNFPTLPGNLYVVVELRGSCSGVAVTSRRAPSSPVISFRMQDSLELFLDQEKEQGCPNEILPNDPPPTSKNDVFVFHENHGRNVEILCDKMVARRVASYNQGIVLVQPPLQVGTMVQVVVEQVDMRWQSSLMVGVVLVPLERLNLPVTALGFRNPSYVVANDYISIGGRKIRSNYGQKLSNLTVGSTVGIKLTECGNFQLVIDGIVDEEVSPFVFLPGQVAYAFFDIYGQCQQIKLVNNGGGDADTNVAVDYEKADLESCEKESANVSVSLPSTSNGTMSVSFCDAEVAHKVSSCLYREDIIKFKNTMLLPNEFFTPDEPICYCIKCYKLKNQDSDAYKDESIMGWVKFPLRNLLNVQTEKWHTAYYGTKLGAVRRILDKGQPLTKADSEWCGLAINAGDDLQVVFHPSLQHCETTGFKTDDNRYFHAAFQLLVKPGAYCVVRESVDWSTKETGALVLHSLLFKFSSN